MTARPVDRAVDRHRSASLRAIGRDAGAELRGSRLVSADGLVDVASPFVALAASADGHDLDLQRGVADQLSMLLRYSNRSQHRTLRPDDLLERVVFDTLEQLRCEALAPPLPGLRRNLTTAFDGWCRAARAAGVSESQTGTLVYTLTHMVRARLVGGFPDEEVDAIIEGPRFVLGPVIGHALRELRSLIADQAAFAEAATEIARLVASIAGDVDDEAAAGLERYRFAAPIEWFDNDAAVTESDAMHLADGHTIDDANITDDLTAVGGYRIYSSAHDVEIDADDLYLDSILRRHRRDLDAMVADQATSAQRLAQRMQRLFGAPQVDDWRFGEDEGTIDARRLSQLITSIDDRRVFRQPRDVVRSNTAVTFLMDNSGSMKTQRFRELAVLIDTYSRALDLAGVANEVLGFSTATWAGGASRSAWEAEGSPTSPGRVADALHVVYKSAETPWRAARPALAAMLRPMHFREGIDGEAIAWAHRRLAARPEPRKVLVVVSDGAPMESTTATANGDGYLVDHLIAVVDRIERRSPVEIGALTLDADISSVFTRSVAIDLDSQLTIGTYGALDLLFGARTVAGTHRA